MKFETFVNALVIAFVTHEFMQDEISASGVKLNALPNELLAKPIIDAYFEKRKTMSHAKAAFELERDLEILQRFADPISAIPKDPEVLAEKFDELFKAHEFQRLADALRKNPEAGDSLIQDFQLDAAKAVQFQTLSELSLMVNYQHQQAKEQKSVTAIKDFPQLSQMIGGFNPERLGIFLGGTGFGKTNFAINLTLSAAKTMGVGYVNMEMGYADMVKRFAVIGTGTSYQDYARGSFEPDDVSKKLRQHGQNIFLTSGRTLSFSQITAWARVLKKKQGLGLLVIDYDQKVDLNLKNQMEEWKALQKVMEAFEDLAKELQVYVLILAQVNRDGLISGSHRAQFPAHTVLAFYEHEVLGPIIEAKKNRHGKKNQALQVLYNEHTSVITELSQVTVEKAKKPERKVLKPKEQKADWWNT